MTRQTSLPVEEWHGRKAIEKQTTARTMHRECLTFLSLLSLSFGFEPEVELISSKVAIL